MKKEISQKWLFVVAVAVALSIFLVFFFFLALPVETESAKVATPLLNTTFAIPVRFRIPIIGVNAPVTSLGLTTLGAMDAPGGPKEVGWLNLSARPGEVGNAVLDGHSGYKNKIPAVFDNLYKLKKGDKIYVEDSKGKTNVFIVRESREYKPNADAVSVFSSSDGKAHLNLITCDGVWNPITKSHSSRLVVFADLE